METMTITVYIGEEEQEMPAKYAVCPTCDGKGHTVLHGIAITAEEWYGPDWDDESREMYLSGGYDTPCETCRGKRVVLVPDRDRATEAQLRAWQEHLEFEALCATERMWERRMAGDMD